MEGGVKRKGSEEEGRVMGKTKSNAHVLVGETLLVQGKVPVENSRPIAPVQNIEESLSLSASPEIVKVAENLVGVRPNLDVQNVSFSVGVGGKEKGEIKKWKRVVRENKMGASSDGKGVTFQKGSHAVVAMEIEDDDGLPGKRNKQVPLENSESSTSAEVGLDQLRRNQ